jgi:type VI protein secretion system component Hcp
MMKNAILAILALSLSLSSVFAAGIYMQTTPEITGDSKVEGFQKWLEPTSVSVGVGRACSDAKSSQRECSEPKFSEMTLTMPTGGATSKLYEAASVGTSYNNIIVALTRQVSAGKTNTYLRFTLSDVFFTGAQTTMTAEGTVDTLSLSFDKIKIESIAVDDNGKETTAPFTYNTATAKAE